MFNDSFYPTPRDLAEKMLTDIDWTFTREVLEPSAGKGDLAEAIQAVQERNYHRWNCSHIHIDTIEIRFGSDFDFKRKRFSCNCK